MVPSSVLLERIQREYPTAQKAHDELNDTARSYEIPGYQGSFGFISSMSDHFCGSCNRLRLTADGQIKVSGLQVEMNHQCGALTSWNQICLFDSSELSLRDAMRQGATDNELSPIIARALYGKKEKHAGMENIDVTTNRPMILIGG
jgi:molybdenum cofactor biosynthesis enzyme MoaA